MVTWFKEYCFVLELPDAALVRSPVGEDISAYIGYLPTQQHEEFSWILSRKPVTVGDYLLTTHYH